jgi:molybdenum-dependent DNA-binding transcriptional regulator ModE
MTKNANTKATAKTSKRADKPAKIAKGPRVSIRDKRYATLKPLIDGGKSLAVAASESGIKYDDAWRAMQGREIPAHAITPRKKSEAVKA